MLGGRVGRDHHDRDVSRHVLALELAADGAPVLTREQNIEDDQVRQAAVLVAQRLGVLTLLAGLDAVPLIFKEEAQRIEDRGVIVDHENERRSIGHWLPSGRSGAAPSPYGRETRKTEPPPLTLVTSIVPPWRRTISWEMNRPMPRPGNVFSSSLVTR